jgi:GNAT superfamily N-acetyltransferase
MTRLRIDPLDLADPLDAQRVSEVFARADAVDRPWHPGYPAAEIQVLATHGWDGDPELFFLGRDSEGSLVAAGSLLLPTRDNLKAALVDVRVVPDHRRQRVGSMFYDHLEDVAAAAGRTRFFTGGPESDAGRRFAESRGYRSPPWG